MGLLADVAGLWRKPVSLKAAAEPPAKPVIPPQPVGITGGGNSFGRLQFETNVLLRDQAAYGRAGTYTVGEWAELALTNPFVTAGLDFICGPIADARIDVEPLPPESGVPEALAKQQADFLKWALTERFKLAAHNDNAARGFLLNGFALYEPRAVLAPCPVLGRPAFALASLEPRLPNSLSPNPWNESAEGVLLGIRQTGPRGGTSTYVTTEIPADRAVLYSWLRQGNNWAGVSQLRSVWYLAHRIMPMLLKLVGVTAQREGAGLPVATATDENAEITPAQREEIMEFFANVSFHESSGIVMPKGFDVKWILSPGSNKNHILDLWNALGLVILQQLSAQQMALGTGETGSRSVGEVHDARAMAFVRKVLSFQEGVLNGDSGEPHTGLVARLLAWNGLSSDAGIPRVKLTPQRPELKPQELSAAVTGFKAAGLLTPRIEDENVVRERLGFAPITEEERDEAKEKAAALAPQFPPGGGGFPPKSDEKPDNLKASAQRGGWVPWRPLRASESKLKLREMDAYFAKRREDFEKGAKPIVAAMLAIAAPSIERAMSDGTVTPAEVAAVPLDDKRLSKFIAEFLRETADKGGEFLREELGGSRLTAAADEQDDKTAEEDDDTDEMLSAQGDLLKRRMLNRLRTEVEREAIDTVRTAGTASEVVERTVFRQLDSGAFRADAGYVTTKAFSLGREEAARQLGGVTSIEYSAILDSNTCSPCAAADGATAAFDSPEHDAMLPPNRDCAGGDNCRCFLIFKQGADE